MKAIVDGKLYDTETATELARRMCSATRTQALYRTARGAHFVAITRTNSTLGIPRERIVPLPDDELVELVAYYVGIEEAVRLFPEKIKIA